VLVAKLGKQSVLKSAQRSILVAGNGQSRGLIAGCMDLDLVFQRIVVEIVYNQAKLDVILFPLIRSCRKIFGGAGQWWV
jgi:hypothetical protein